MEKPLLPDTDHGGVGKAVGKSEAEQGTEAPEAIGGMETGTSGGICGEGKIPD